MRRLAIGQLTLWAMLFAFCSCDSESADLVTVNPDGSIVISFTLEEGIPYYALAVDNQPVISLSRLGFRLASTTDLTGPFRILESEKSEIKETWQPVWGQESDVYSHSYQTRIALQEIKHPKRLLNLYFRAFNDGVAFRYEIPEQKGIDTLLVADELTEYNFAEDAEVWWIPADYNNFEKIYTRSALSELRDSVHTPLTMRTESGLILSLHEANLIDYSSMTLKPLSGGRLSLKAELIPWSDGLLVKTGTPMFSPWRTITIGRDDLDLLRSRMILNLNPPNQLQDVSWISPMKYIGIWWGMHIGKYTFTQGEHHGATTENVKRYIDFAAANNIQGVLAEGWNHDWERYGEAQAFNFTQPYDDFDINELSRYARNKGVYLISHHETGREAPYYEKQLDAAYTFLEKHEIHVVKTGYAGEDNIYPVNETHQGQYMVEHHRRVLRAAAAHQVMLNVHEPIKPTGEERTWPNMMTREGTRGMEWNAWSIGNPPSHTTILPFTRQVAGPIDYTPGIFDLFYDEYRPDNRVHSTLAKQLALMVVLYSPMQMAADLIENYSGQPAFQFIRDLYTDWDESKYLSGKIGEYLAVVRRQGTEWFLGAITNEESRVLAIPLAEFLEEDMIAECYVDGAEADWESNPYPMHIGKYLATPSDTLRAMIAPGGGLAVRFFTAGTYAEALPEIKRLMMDQ